MTKLPTWLALLMVGALAIGGTASAAVDANTASKDELRTVRGIGPSTADRIIAERRKGPYKSLADLEARVKGIGDATARKMAANGLTIGRGASPPGRGTGAVGIGIVTETRIADPMQRSTGLGAGAQKPLRAAAAAGTASGRSKADAPSGRAFGREPRPTLERR